jgi:hypothetical protein
MNYLYRNKRRIGNLGAVYDPGISNCIDLNTGMAIACPGSDDPWLGWQIILAMAVAGLTSYAQVQGWQQTYAQQGVGFQPLNYSQYSTAYNIIKQAHPEWSDSQINRLLSHTNGTGETPTWVWIALAAAGILVLLPMIMKKG